MAILQARQLTLNDIHRLFGFQSQYDGSFSSLLSLQVISETEEKELIKIRDNFRHYLVEESALEGQIKMVAVAPLLRLAGFYDYPLQLKLETNIAQIELENQGDTITGKLDIIAINKAKEIERGVYFWILVIESKRSSINAVAGIPQLLTYAYTSLAHQSSVWGLATNGMHYQFVYIQRGNYPTYLYLPMLSLLESESANKLLQVLQAISKL